MNKISKVWIALLLLCSLHNLQAQGYQVGSIIKDFSLPDVNGRSISLGTFKDPKGFIIVFTSNSCPFSKLYEERLNALSTKYSSQGYFLIAINANNPAVSQDDDFEQMKTKSKDKLFNFPYLYDENQVVTSQFSPSRTPHAFIVVFQNRNYKVVYSGAIDDNPANLADVKINYIDNAINDLLAGRKVAFASTKPVGCTIKWDKKK